jgi:hypothetical protein
MVFAMPPQGLDETVSSLWDIIDFHRDRVEFSPRAIEGRELLTGRVVEVGDRSPLTVEE